MSAMVQWGGALPTPAPVQPIALSSCADVISTECSTGGNSGSELGGAPPITAPDGARGDRLVWAVLAWVLAFTVLVFPTVFLAVPWIQASDELISVDAFQLAISLVHRRNQ